MGYVPLIQGSPFVIIVHDSSHNVLIYNDNIVAEPTEPPHMQSHVLIYYMLEACNATNSMIMDQVAKY
jgi:hypothetical protein